MKPQIVTRRPKTTAARPSPVTSTFTSMIPSALILGGDGPRHHESSEKCCDVRVSTASSRSEIDPANGLICTVSRADVVLQEEEVLLVCGTAASRQCGNKSAQNGFSHDIRGLSRPASIETGHERFPTRGFAGVRTSYGPFTQVRTSPMFARDVCGPWDGSKSL